MIHKSQLRAPTVAISAWLPLGTSVHRAARGRFREVRTPKTASHSGRRRRSTVAHWYRNPPGTGVLEPDMIQGSPAVVRVIGLKERQTEITEAQAR